MEKLTEKFIIDNENGDINDILLHKDRYHGIDIETAVQCIQARRSIKAKIPEWYRVTNLLYPLSLSIEQASSAITAKYKQNFISENSRIADFTGGMGIDCYYMAQKALSAHYFEKNDILVNAAENNFEALKCDNIIVTCAEISQEYLKSIKDDTFDLIYLDPARRSQSGKRIYSISDCEPNIQILKPHLLRISPTILVKVSPMADISSIVREYPEVAEIHILSINNECKEVLLFMNREYDGGNPMIKAIDPESQKQFSFFLKEEYEASAEFLKPEEINEFSYLYEPETSVLKSGAFKLLSQRYDITKISKGTHYYMSSKIIEEFPGKIRHIIDTVEFNNKGRREIAKKYPECSVTCRNYPSASEEIKKRLGLKESGRLRMLVTTLNNSSRYAIISESVDKTIKH